MSNHRLESWRHLWFADEQVTPLAGVALRILSGILFVAMAVCVKAIGDQAALGQIVFFRSAVALLPLVLFLWLRGEFPGGLRTRHPLGHVLRCLFGAAAMFTSFATLRLLPVAEATMLAYLAPVIMVVLAALVLHEWVGLRRWLSVGLGMTGVAVLMLPDSHPEAGRMLGVMLGLATAILTAAALIQVRRLNLLGESPGAIAFYFALVAAALGLVTAPFGWQYPDPLTLLLLIAAGLFGGGAHIAMTLSFRYAQASLLAPFEYLTLLWATLAGLLFFAEIPTFALLVAAPLMVAAAVIAAGSAPGSAAVGKRKGTQT